MQEVGSVHQESKRPVLLQEYKTFGDVDERWDRRDFACILERDEQTNPIIRWYCITTVDRRSMALSDKSSWKPRGIVQSDEKNIS